MKRLTLVMAALAALCVPAALVLGQESFKEKVDQTLTKVDLDKDGKLSREEATKTYQQMQDELKPLEDKPWSEEVSKQRQAIYDKYEGVLDLRSFLGADDNDDLTVTRDELGEYYVRVFTKSAKGPPQLSDKDYTILSEQQMDEMWPKLMKFDADKDGKLSREEAVKFGATQMKEDDERWRKMEATPTIDPPKDK